MEKPLQNLWYGHIVSIRHCRVITFIYTRNRYKSYFIRKGEIGMEIERINEDTVKFFLSYIDIEERGFTREEVWNNREKSEELFWDMMDEINEEAEFVVEGPLWIQVHAKNEGIEVTVTRALPTDGQDSPFDEDDPRRMFQQANVGSFHDIEDLLTEGLEKDSEWTENTFSFGEFEDVIRIASRMHGYVAQTSLYSYENKFYLHVVYDAELMDNNQKTNMFSVLSEFGKPSKMTIHILEEYGNVIIAENVFMEIDKYF